MNKTLSYIIRPKVQILMHPNDPIPPPYDKISPLCQIVSFGAYLRPALSAGDPGCTVCINIPTMLPPIRETPRFELGSTKHKRGSPSDGELKMQIRRYQCFSFKVYHKFVPLKRPFTSSGRYKFNYCTASRVDHNSIHT